MEKDLHQDKAQLKKDLVKIFVFFGLVVILMTVIYFLDQRMGFMSQLSGKITKFLISQ